MIRQDAAAFAAIATRTRLARFAVVAMLLLAVHAVVAARSGWPPQLFGLHLGVTLLVAIAAILQEDRRRRAIDRLAADLAAIERRLRS